MLRAFASLRVFLAIALSLFVLGTARAAPQEAKFKNLRFSKEELELLKDIKKIEDAAAVTQSLLKATPFIQIFASTTPLEMAITVTTNDWDRIGPAVSAMGKIRACKISGEIAAFRADNLADRKKHPNPAFFEQLRTRYDVGC
jgi:hypothetical protein